MQGSYAFWSVEHLYTQGDGTAQALAYVQYQGFPKVMLLSNMTFGKPWL
jgi:hypothetical protein